MLTLHGWSCIAETLKGLKKNKYGGHIGRNEKKPQIEEKYIPSG